MSEKIIKFFGSASDLKDLRKVLSDAGFEEDQKITIHATDASGGGLIPLSIVFIVRSIPEISKCVQVYLKERSKRMVTRDDKGLTIRGNFTAQEFGDIYERCNRFTIEDNKHDT